MALPIVRVEVAFTAPILGAYFVIGDPDKGRIGAYGIGPDEVWVQLPQSAIRSWSIRRGSTRPNDGVRRYDPGTATVVLNDGDRDFDPDNLAGPYVAGGVTQLVPMRRMRIIAEWSDAAYTLFTGFVDDWVPDYQDNFWTYTTLTATDGTKVLQGVDRTAVTTVGAGEATGARVSRILNSAGWPAADRDIDTGSPTLQATDLSQNALTELQLVQDTEVGDLYIDELGRVVFRGRRAPLTDAQSRTSQATFGDGGYAATAEIPYAACTLTSLDDVLINRVLATRVGGTVQTAENAASQTAYLLKTYQRDDLIMQTDAQATDWAGTILHQHDTPERQYDRIEFNTPSPELAAVIWPSVLGRQFGDRITIRRRPAGGGTLIEHDALVRGVEHQSDGAQWTSALMVQGAGKYSFFTIGDPVLGRIGAYPIGF